MVLQESQGDVKEIIIRQCGIHAACSAGAVFFVIRETGHGQIQPV